LENSNLLGNQESVGSFKLYVFFAKEPYRTHVSPRAETGKKVDREIVNDNTGISKITAEEKCV